MPGTQDGQVQERAQLPSSCGGAGFLQANTDAVVQAGLPGRRSRLRPWEGGRGVVPSLRDRGSRRLCSAQLRRARQKPTLKGQQAAGISLCRPLWVQCNKQPLVLLTCFVWHPEGSAGLAICTARHKFPLWRGVSRLSGGIPSIRGAGAGWNCPARGPIASFLAQRCLAVPQPGRLHSGQRRYLPSPWSTSHCEFSHPEYRFKKYF